MKKHEVLGTTLIIFYVKQNNMCKYFVKFIKREKILKTSKFDF